MEEIQKQNYIHAGFWVRFWSFILDTFFFVSAALIILIILSPLFELSLLELIKMFFKTNLNLQSVSINNFLLVIDVITISFTIYLWSKWRGQSPGKYILGIRIVSFPNYQNITLRQAIIRYFSYIISGITFLIGFLMIGLRKDKRGLHDLIADTCVIYREK